MIRRLLWANNIFNKGFILTDSSKFYASRYCSNKSNVTEMKYLNVAEKNDAAKNIAAHLSRGTARRREGYSPYNKIYEFDGNIFGQTCKMVMTSVSGHLLTFEFVGSYRGWQTCSPLSLFEAPVMKSCPENYHKIKQTLEREIKGCQGLIIWTDCDREGENIGYEIIQVCTEVKSNLKILRAKFSEITATSVNRALQTLGDPNKNVSDAVDVRQELDLRIGAAFTRFQTLRLQKVFPGQLSNNLVSYGSCQFPTLGFVVERYRAVEKFVPESFWKIKVSHTLNDLTVDFAWKRNRLFDEPACLVIHDICSENPNATVQSIKSKPKSKWRPLPLDTVEMEKLGSRKLRINAKEVMKIAEKLYTQGIISYPRTETNIYPKELDLGSLVTVQTVDPDWGPFARGIMESGGPTPRQGKKSDQAHPPIHPTKHVTNLSGNEKKVYDLIVRSFLACCSKDAQGHETIVDVDIAGEKFTANGLMIIARNYLDVYPYDKWSGKEIHVYEEGQVFLPTQMDVVGGETSAPSLLTEADLIALMEKHGIGTDATHADHIETIKSRSYVALADNIHFVPGMLGMGLVEGYDSMGLSFSKPLLRAGLEADLKEVCEGRKNSRAVLAEQIAKYRDVYLTVSQEAQKIDQALSIRFNQQPQATANNDHVNPESHKRVMKCPKCSSDMTLRTKKDGQGFYIGCMSFPQCKNVIWLPSIVNRIVITDSTCETCGPSYSKLEMHWNGRSLEHLYPSPYVCCIGGCDTGILQVLNVNIAVVRPNNISMDSGLGTSTRTLTQNSSSNTTASQRRPQSVQPNRPQNVNNSSNMTNWLRNDNDIPSNNAQTARPQNTSTWNNNSNDSGFTSNSWGNNSRAGSTDTSSDSRTNSRGSSNARGGQSNIPSRGGRTGNQNQPWGQGNNSSSRNPPANNNDDENHILCQCGNEALLLTVRKASVNQGRQFYKCAKPQNTGECDFFLWAAENGENNTNTTDSRPSGNSNTNSNWGDGSSTNNSNSWGNNNTGNSNNPSSSWGNPGANRGSGSNTYDDSDSHKCNCDLPCKIATVFREGPNKGKRFYGCPNPADRRCNFFEWVDDDSSSSGPSAPSRGRGRGRGSRGRGGNPSARGSNSNSTRGTGERGRKKCGLCREEGHTRNRCPQNDQN